MKCRVVSHVLGLPWSQGNSQNRGCLHHSNSWRFHCSALVFHFRSRSIGPVCNIIASSSSRLPRTHLPPNTLSHPQARRAASPPAFSPHVTSPSNHLSFAPHSSERQKARLRKFTGNSSTLRRSVRPANTPSENTRRRIALAAPLRNGDESSSAVGAARADSRVWATHCQVPWVRTACSRWAGAREGHAMESSKCAGRVIRFRLVKGRLRRGHLRSRRAGLADSLVARRARRLIGRIGVQVLTNTALSQLFIARLRDGCVCGMCLYASVSQYRKRQLALCSGKIGVWGLERGETRGRLHIFKGLDSGSRGYLSNLPPIPMNP